MRYTNPRLVCFTSVQHRVTASILFTSHYMHFLYVTTQKSCKILDNSILIQTSWTVHNNRDMLQAHYIVLQSWTFWILPDLTFSRKPLSSEVNFTKNYALLYLYLYMFCYPLHYPSLCTAKNSSPNQTNGHRARSQISWVFAMDSSFRSAVTMMMQGCRKDAVIV